MEKKLKAQEEEILLLKESKKAVKVMRKLEGTEKLNLEKENKKLRNLEKQLLLKEKKEKNKEDNNIITRDGKEEKDHDDNDDFLKNMSLRQKKTLFKRINLDIKCAKLGINVVKKPIPVKSGMLFVLIIFYVAID